MSRKTLPLLLCTLSLPGCMHMGTHVAGDFACRAPKGACQPLRAVDAEAVRDMVAPASNILADSHPRISVAANDTARTGERTLRIVMPAHVDASGTLHEEAVAWAVIEPARWAGELRRAQGPAPKALARNLRRALNAQSQAADTPLAAPQNPDLGALSPEDTAPFTPLSPFGSAAPLVLPSPGGAAGPDARALSAPASGAEGSAMSLPQHAQTSRPLTISDLPTAAAIDAAKAKAPSGKAPE